MAPLQREALGEVVLEKFSAIICMLDRVFSRDSSAVMEVCDYLDIPIAPWGAKTHRKKKFFYIYKSMC